MADISVHFSTFLSLCSRVTTVKVFVCLNLKPKSPAGRYFDRQMLNFSLQISLFPRLADASKVEENITGPFSSKSIVVFIITKCKEIKLTVK
jgi:hypothetical protein